MAEKLRTAAYAAIIIAAAVVVVTALSAPVLMQPIPADVVVYHTYPATVLKDMFGDDAYKAMYERYPSAAEKIAVTSMDVNMDVEVTDPETGNTLGLWLYADPHSSSIQTSANCQDTAENNIGSSVGMSTAEFIRTTDCVSPPAIMQPVPQDEPVFPNPLDIVEDMRAEDAYVAMYERYPDAVEWVDAAPHQVLVEVSVINTDTGNNLILWLYADPYSSGYQMSATCRDGAGSVIGDGSATLFSTAFIKTTDCVSPP